MGLSAVTLGFGAYSIAAILTGFWLLGIETGEKALLTLSIYAFIAFLALFLNSLSFIFQAPLGNQGIAVNIQQLFALLTALFSFVWLGFSIAVIYNLDFPIVGGAALILFIFNLIGFLIFFMKPWANALGGYTAFPYLILQINMIFYLLVEFGFYAFTHGLIGATLQGLFITISGFTNILVVFFLGGILPTPKTK